MTCFASNTRSNSSVILSRLDGWIPLNGLYDPGTFPVNINTAPWSPTSIRSIGFTATDVFHKGDKVKVVTNLGNHYGIVTAVSASAATVTSLNGAVYRPNPTVAANTVVNEVWISRQANPVGWPGWLTHTIAPAEFLQATFLSASIANSAISIGAGTELTIRICCTDLQFSAVTGSGGKAFLIRYPPGALFVPGFAPLGMLPQGGFFPTALIAGPSTVVCYANPHVVNVIFTAGNWPLNTSLYLNIMYTHSLE